jgi:hypothetical protein
MKLSLPPILILALALQAGTASATEYTAADWQSLLAPGHGDRPAVAVIENGKPRTGPRAGSILRAVATETLIEPEGRRKPQTLLQVAVREGGEALGVPPHRVALPFIDYFRLLTNQGKTPLRTVSVDRKAKTVTLTVGVATQAQKPFILGPESWARFQTVVRDTTRRWKGSAQEPGIIQLEGTTVRRRAGADFDPTRGTWEGARGTWDPKSGTWKGRQARGKRPPPRSGK